MLTPLCAPTPCLQGPVQLQDGGDGRAAAVGWKVRAGGGAPGVASAHGCGPRSHDAAIGPRLYATAAALRLGAALQRVDVPGNATYIIMCLAFILAIRVCTFHIRRLILPQPF